MVGSREISRFRWVGELVGLRLGYLLQTIENMSISSPEQDQGPDAEEKSEPSEDEQEDFASHNGELTTFVRLSSCVAKKYEQIQNRTSRRGYFFEVWRSIPS